MCKCDVRNNDEMKTKKKWSFRAESGGALNWPAIMLLENEDYVSIDMKLIRNKENNRITFNSNIWTHHLKECSSIRQHQKRTRKQKRLETKSNRTSSSPHHWEMKFDSTVDSNYEKQNFNGSVWQTYTDHPILCEDSNLHCNRISEENIPCTMKHRFNRNGTWAWILVQDFFSNRKS